MAETTEILNIEVDVKEAVKAIEDYKNKIEILKKEKKKLKDAYDSEKITLKEYNEALTANRIELESVNSVLKDSQKELKNSLSIYNEEINSLRSMRAELSSLTMAYDKLSEADRNAAKGQELQKKINDLSKEIKSAEEATGRFQRNVGNYEGAIKNAIASTNPFVSVIINMTNGANTAGTAFTALKSGVTAFGTALKTLAANPVFLILAGLSAIVMAIVEAIKSSEEATNRWNVVLAPFQRMLSGVLSLIQTVAGWILSAVESAAKLADMVMSALGKVIPGLNAINEANRRAIELEKEKIAITKQERENLVQNAKDDLEIAQLRKASRDKENLTAQERLAALDKADKMEEERAKREEDLALRKLEAAKEEASWAENSKETNDELAKLEADYYNKQKEYFTKTQRLAQQRQSVLNEIAAEEKARAEEEKKREEERIKAAEELAKAEREAIQKAEDAMIAIMEEGTDKQLKLLDTQHERRKKELQDEIEERKKNGQLSKTMLDALNKQLLLLDEQYQKDRKNIVDNADKELLKKQIDDQKKLIDLKLASVEEGTLAEYSLRLESLELQKQAELEAAEDNAEMKHLIESKYLKLSLDEDEKYRQEVEKRQNEAMKQEIEAEKLKWENRIAEARIKGENYNAIELESLQNALNVQRMQGESEDEFRARQLAAQEAYVNKKREIDEAEIAMQQSKVQAIGQVFNSLSSMLELAGENNIAALKLSKVLAIAEIAMQQGIAIANAVRAGSNATNVFQMIAQIGTAIATVTISIATAIKSIRQAEKQIADAEKEKQNTQFDKMPKVSVKGYSRGGSVGGIGTGTSDSNPAMLSRGESVMTAATTSLFAPILSAFNQVGGGVPIQAQVPAGVTINNASEIGMDMLANAFERGAKRVKIYTDVREITTAQNRVKVIESNNTMTTKKR